MTSPPDTTLNTSDAGSLSAGLVGGMIALYLFLVVIFVIISYFSHKGMVKWGYCSDGFWKYTGKTILNGLTGNILGIVLNFTLPPVKCEKAEKPSTKSKK